MTAVIGHGKRKRRYKSRGLPDRFVAWVEYERDPDTGKRRRVTKEFARAADRDEWLVEQLREANGAEALERQQRRRRLTVGDVLDRYLEHAGGAKPWSPSHARRTKQVVEHDLEPLRALDAKRLAPSTVERYFATRLQAGAKPNTVRLARVALQAAYNLAIRDRVITSGYNPAAMTVLEVKREPPRFLDLDQARTFVEKVQAHDHGPLYTVATVLALRPGEAIGLHWDDLDTDESAIEIRRNVQLVDGEYHVLPPKADSRRRVPVPDPVLDLLETHREHLKAQRVGSVVMFPNTSGGYLNEPMLNRRLAKILEKAGLPRIPFYGLRHTGATVMLAMGVPVETIREIMGHSAIAVTLRYAHVTASLRRDAADKMGQFLTSDRAAGGTTGGTD